MSLDATLNLLGLLLSGALTGMLAGLLRWFSTPAPRRHYQLWTAAWFATAAYYLIGATSFAVGVVGAPSPAVRFGLSVATQVASTLGCVLLVLGAVGFARSHPPSRQRVRGAMIAAVVIGIAVAAAAQFGNVRLVRQIYRSGLAASSFLIAGAVLWRARGPLDRSGRFLAVALAGFALAQVHLFIYMMASVLGYPPGYDLGIFTLLDLPWVAAIVATMAGMALADQRAMNSAALHRQEAQFRQLIENSSDVLLVLGDTFAVRYASPSARRILGWGDELVGQALLPFVHPDDHAKVRALAGREGPVATPFVLRFRAKAGNWLRLEAVATRVADEDGGDVLIVNARDLAERDRLEANLRESQKLESVGQLAGGVAHDLNNILTVIGGTAELGRLSAGSEPFHQSFDEIIRATGRAADLTRGLLSFARRQVVASVVFDVADAVARVGKMAKRLLPATIEFRVRKSGGAAYVNADPGQLEQVLMNLVVNARDAIVGHGVIEVTTGVAMVTAATRPEVVPGLFVTVSVSDTGSGISAQVRPHLFEPFFTTKAVGEGTGLGLATSYGIVAQAGGFIDVQSDEGKGARFVVHLPAAAAGAVAASAAHGEMAQARGECVLVVEDDPAVRTVTAGMLRAAGYQVIEARDGVDGLERAAGQPVRVLVTDMVMPRLNGLELARRLREDHPHIGVLFMSGYSGDPGLLQSLPDRTLFIQKPYQAPELTERVHALL